MVAQRLRAPASITAASSGVGASCHLSLWARLGAGDRLRSQRCSGETLLSEQVIGTSKPWKESGSSREKAPPLPATLWQTWGPCALFSLSLESSKTKLSLFPWFSFAQLSSGVCLRERTGAERKRQGLKTELQSCCTATRWHP